MTSTTYPLRVEGELDPGASRWLWLVKWVLAIPHYLVLVVLWIVFVLLTMVAGVAILFTGRYPRALFDFNVGVLRWSWRVLFYSYAALGTDRYPPFTLGEVPDYPARLEVDYPDRLSRGLVLVKWWLLAIPHYIVIALLCGQTFGWLDSPWSLSFPGGLIGVLVLFAAIALLFTGVYPRSLFDFVLGLDRWVLRVAAYAGLMTDVYPPFRLDMGGRERTGVEITTRPEPEGTARGAVAMTPASRWSAGQVILVVVGSLATLAALVVLVGGIAVTVIDRTQRDADSFLMTPTETFSSTGYAVVSESADVETDGARFLRWFLGTVKLRSEADRPMFVGIARAADVEAYLGGVARSTVTDLDTDRPTYRESTGGAPSARPSEQDIWVASATGAGNQALTWEPEEGDWSVVAMNADGSSGIDVELAIGAELDKLGWIEMVMIVGGLVVLLGGAGLILLGINSHGRERPVRG
jgi:hypothetical protein